MKKIPFISSNPELFQQIQELHSRCRKTSTQLVFLENSEKALEYLNIEMPDLLFVDFSAGGLDGFRLMENMMADPWLLNGSIIALSEDNVTFERLNKFPQANILVVIPIGQFPKALPKIISVVENNQRIIFQRQIGSDLLGTISGSYVINNDLYEGLCYANLFSNFLFYSNKISLEGKVAINLVLTELLVNAIEHGNCEITYEEKSNWMATSRLMADLIEEKCRNPELANRKVVFEYTIQNDRSRFSITDAGKGFDWKSQINVNPFEKLDELHGRGIFLSKSMTAGLNYNDKGNQVNFEFSHQKDGSNLTPGLFKDIDPQKIKAGETVFKQGEESNCLYYICKGRYEVLVNNRGVSQLTPDDIFLGEMSFLLGDTRSATIRALTDGELIQIAKTTFFNAVKTKPHYAMMLCRLLAQRINRVNLKI